LTNARGETGWATATAGFEAQWSADDVSFIREATSTVLSQYNFAENAGAYAIGFSFGGDMAFRLSCEASDLFLGFGVTGQAGAWAGGISANGRPWKSSCAPSPARRPLWMAMGTNDNFYTASAAEASFHSYSTSVLGCAANSYETYVAVSGVTCKRYTGCLDLVPAEYCEYERMTHIHPTSNTGMTGGAVSDSTGLGPQWQATTSAWRLWHLSSLPPSPPPPSGGSSANSSGGSNNLGVIIAAAGGGALALLLIVVAGTVLYCKKRKKLREKEQSSGLGGDLGGVPMQHVPA